MDFTKNLETAMKHFSSTGGFLSVKSETGVNTMTISWGFIGFIWNKPHFIVVVRPQRYTKKILDNAVDFTVSIPFGTLKEELKICGTQSGADIDKSTVVKFIDSKTTQSPIVGGCDTYYECRIKYVDKFEEDLLASFVKEHFYNDDYHHVYIGEIVECYGK